MARQLVSQLVTGDSKPQDFNRPGHIFPLKYREGGILKRAGHTEASVDLAMLAGLEPVAVLCEIVDDDGSMERLPRLRQFAQAENLKIISIADLSRFRDYSYFLPHLPVAQTNLRGIFLAVVSVSKNIGEKVILVELAAAAPILTLWGPFKAYSRCDCGNQLALAMKQIEAAGGGVLVCLRVHEGRGIGLGHKLRAYNLQDDGRDTVEANEVLGLGLPVDSRKYGIGAQILRDLGVHTMKLMTNNPAKYVGLKGYGLAIAGRVPLLTPITRENRRYLETKHEKMGHVYGSNSNGHVNGANQ
uniref:GTP cyclohydrolase II domain-containing protein n=1 Tax=Manihot esculenta TaxID=3983 RepID=A0A2C9USF1_MANES